MNPFLMGGALGAAQPPAMDSRTMGPPQPSPDEIYAALQQQRMAQAPYQGPPRPQGPMQMPPIPAQRPTQAVSQAAEQLRALYGDPRKKRMAQHVGSALLPALFAGLVGGNMRDMIAYGAGSAAFNYRSELDKFKDTEAAIAQAEAKLPAEEVSFDKERALTAAAYASAAGVGARRGGTPLYQTWVDQGMPGLDDPAAASPTEIAEAFGKWSRDYTNNTLAPRTFDTPFENTLILPDGTIIRQGPGPLSPSAIQAEVTKAGETAGATERWKLNEQQYNALADVNYDMQRSLRAMQKLRTTISNSQQTGPGAHWQAIIDSDLQYLRSLFSEAVLAKASAARAAGVTFGAMTIAEWEMLAQTVAKLDNSKETNLKIVDDLIEKLEHQLHDNMIRLTRLPAGSAQRPELPPMNETPAAEPGGPRKMPSGGTLTIKK